jgi:hypothetical protein
MKKRYLSVLAVLVLVLLTGPRVYAADNNSRQVESELDFTLLPDVWPHATSYYDDLVDHYEQEQLMRDVIAQCAC